MTLLSELPDPPTLSDSQADFDTKAGAFLTALQTMVTQINAGLGGTAVNLTLTGTTSATSVVSTGGMTAIGTPVILQNGIGIGAGVIESFGVDTGTRGSITLRTATSTGGSPLDAFVIGANGGATLSGGLTVAGIVTPEADNTRTLGTGALRWSTVYAGTGTINTSDARQKTEVSTLTSDEISAAKDISKKFGSYQFLSAVAAKGEEARTHIGLTVQSVIAILESHNLAPVKYAFICYDKWDDVFVEHPAIEAVEEVKDEEGNITTLSVEAKAAWTEQTRVAGDTYGFRMDELLVFIAAGFEARLAALEAK